MPSALSVCLTVSAFTSQVDAMQLVGVQKVSLSWGDWSCPCVGIDGSIGDMNLSIKGEVALYPANLGTSCEAWDDGRYPGACEDKGGDPGKGKGYCAQKWCYVDPCTCNKAREKAIYMKGATFKDRPLYYSYDTCDGTDTFTVRDGKEEGLLQEADVEIGEQIIAPLESSNMDAHGGIVHMAEVVDMAMHQSHQQGEGEEMTAPENMKNKNVRTEKVKSHKSTSVHKHPDKEDKDSDVEDHGVLKELSKELKKVCSQPIDEKVVGRGGCRCIGIKHKTMKWEAEVNISNKVYLYPTDIGNYCGAWDKDVHPECRSESKEKPSWCDSSWCYVDPCTCPVYSTKVSDEGAYIQKARFEGHPLFYSYQACGHSDPWSFKNNVDACINRKTEDDCSGDCKWSKDDSACLENTVSSYCEVKINRMESWQAATKANTAGSEKHWWQFW